jgi:hypothetical protein
MINAITFEIAHYKAVHISTSRVSGVKYEDWSSVTTEH